MAVSYFLNRKRSVCVVSLRGMLSDQDSEMLDLCLKETMAEPAAHCVLNLGGLTSVEPGAARLFTQFQQGLRAGSRLYLSDLQPSAGKTLRELGVIRESELHDDLLSCLQAILDGEKG